MPPHATALPDNAAKSALWQAYHARRPPRVPVRLNVNPRVVLNDPELNRAGYSFEDAANDPRIAVEVSLMHQHHLRMTLNDHTDAPTGLPEVWEVSLEVYNVYEAAYFGAAVRFPAHQVPATEPVLDSSDYGAVLAVDIERPLENPYIADRLAFWKQMERACRDLRYEGRPVRLRPWALFGSDGPITVACNLRGTDFLAELLEQPEQAQRLLAHLTEAAIRRRDAFARYWGDRVRAHNGLADDACAMLSPGIYKKMVLPHHQRWYEAGPATPRSMHLCGDASHLFPTLHRELGVTSFDTGFPIDFGQVRRELGPDVEISGGVPVDLLLSGTPDAVHERTRTILQSGVKEGGRFILQEANNLPPRCPPANLAAMYETSLACGGHGTGAAGKGGG